MAKFEYEPLGKLDVDLLTDTFGHLLTNEVIITAERIRHIKFRHPEDYALFEQFGVQVINDPDFIIQDLDHVGTIFMVRRLPETNLNVVIRLVLEEDDPDHKNSVMTFYRLREKNLQKQIAKNKLLYKKE